MCVRACFLSCFSHVDSVQPYGWQPTRLLCPWDSPDKNTGVGYCALLQGIFPTQGSNLSLLCLPAWTGGLFTSSAPWEARSGSTHAVSPPLMQWAAANVTRQRPEKCLRVWACLSFLLSLCHMHMLGPAC